MYYTPKQLAILRFILEHRSKTGVSPTLEEIGSRFGVSKITIFEHIGALEKKGAITRAKGRSRSVEVIDPELTGNGRRSLPMVGTIAAGKPIEAVETVEEVDLCKWIPGGKECFALRVKGDSMIGEQIRQGDYVIVERRTTAEDGEMVVAVLNGEEATLKRFYREGNRVRLQPANDKYPPVIADRVDIRGIVIGVMRKY